MIRRFLALAAGAILTAVLALGVAMAADATTGTCLGTQNPVSGPVSCGGLYLPAMNPSGGIQPSTGSLTLTAAQDFWDAPITFSLYNSNLQTQDFTVYERCTFGSPAGTRTETNPCGSPTPAACAATPSMAGCPVLNVASSRPEFVAEITPLGQHLGGAINNIGNLCISWEAQRIGPAHKFRFAMVERTCDTYGAFFTGGTDDGIFPSPPFSNTGVPGIVVNPNPFQTFAAIPAGGGDLIANDALSHNFFDVLFVVDDKGLAYPNGAAILYPENGQKNQVSAFIGCNGAVLTTGVHFTCPLA